MKKLITLIAIAVTACGPSAEEIKKAEQVKKDSIQAFQDSEHKKTMDSLALYKTKMEARYDKMIALSKMDYGMKDLEVMTDTQLDSCMDHRIKQMTAR